MRTPKAYTENLRNGIITEEMFGGCLYSANKRAKNFRDNAREQRRRYGRYADTSANNAKKMQYYREKEFFLQFLKPVALHKEILERNYLGQDVRYYLYYRVGGYSFHSPIDASEVKGYKELPVKELDDFVTQGEGIVELLSTQFIKSVILRLCSGKYDLQVENKVSPLPIISDIPDFIKVKDQKIEYVPPKSDITTIVGYYGDEETPFEYVYHFASKKASIEEAKKLKMKITSKTTMRNAVEYIAEHGDLLDFASRTGIGVEKKNYINSGMSDSEYKRLSRKMKIVGTGQFGSWKTKVNKYDIRQYLSWRNTGVIS